MVQILQDLSNKVCSYILSILFLHLDCLYTPDIIFQTAYCCVMRTAEIDDYAKDDRPGDALL